MLPVGVITANAAGGAAATPTCTKAAGTATFTPPLPDLTSSTKVSAKLSSKGTVSGCTGGGVTKGTTSFVQTSKPTPGNCKTLATPTASTKGTIGTLTVKWSNGKTSTAKGFVVKQKTSPITDATTTGKITSGAFVGKTISGTVSFKLPAGACSKGHPLKSVTYTNKTGTKFIVK